MGPHQEISENRLTRIEEEEEEKQQQQ